MPNKVNRNIDWITDENGDVVGYELRGGVFKAAPIALMKQDIDTIEAGGVPDADKGDITVSGGGTVWTIDPNAVDNTKMADVPTATMKGRATAGTGDPEDLTATQVRALLNVASGATANATDAQLRDRTTHTGTQTASTISDFNSAARAQVEAELIAGANVTITPGGSGATRTLTIAAAVGAGATNLSYTPATRVLASDTGADATLPLVSSTEAGLAPASGGGTTNFLRADNTWAAPPGGGGGVTEDPVSVTGNTTLTWPGAQGKYHIVNSAGAVALTLPTGAIADASKIIGMNIGAGALSFTAQGGDTIAQHAILPSTVDQYSPFELRRSGTVWVRVA